MRAARLAAAAGADGITAHLREDRRHISDDDIARLTREIDLPLNLEMAATEEMLAIALRHRPHAACLVPGEAQERDDRGRARRRRRRGAARAASSRALGDAGIRVSLFIEPEPRQLEAAQALGAPVVELHTGAYCDAAGAGARARARSASSTRRRMAERSASNAMPATASASTRSGRSPRSPTIVELNIGHFLIGEAIFGGLDAAIQRMRALMDEARGARGEQR